MPATTNLTGYPYPLIDDPIDVVGDVQRLAIAFDNEPGFRRVFPSLAALNAGWAPVNGAHAYTTAEGVEWLRRDGVWVDPSLDDAVVAVRDAAVTPHLIYNTVDAEVVYQGGVIPSGSQMVITAVNDPNEFPLLTQVGNAVQLNRGGIYALSMQISRGPANAYEEYFLVYTPGSYPIRKWRHYVPVTEPDGWMVFSWTGHLAANSTLTWLLNHGNTDLPSNGPSSMVVCPINFTT